jgi:hypothetical protein
MRRERVGGGALNQSCMRGLLNATGAKGASVTRPWPTRKAAALRYQGGASRPATCAARMPPIGRRFSSPCKRMLKCRQEELTVPIFSTHLRIARERRGFLDRKRWSCARQGRCRMLLSAYFDNDQARSRATRARARHRIRLALEDQPPYQCRAIGARPAKTGQPSVGVAELSDGARRRGPGERHLTQQLLKSNSVARSNDSAARFSRAMLTWQAIPLANVANPAQANSPLVPRQLLEETLSQAAGIAMAPLGHVVARKAANSAPCATPESNEPAARPLRYRSTLPISAEIPCANSTLDSAAPARRFPATSLNKLLDIRAADGCRP